MTDIPVVLPVDIRASNATYGTQFGLIERPTHRNTVQDQAKFEVCAHGLADLSDRSYGVSFFAKDKYGFSVEGNVMRMTLLRAPTAPDPKTDEGKHVFQFGINAHPGGVSSEVVKQARAFAHPPITRAGAALRLGLPSFDLTGQHAQSVVLDTIKMAEDQTLDKTVILRFYESVGTRSSANLELYASLSTSA